MASARQVGFTLLEVLVALLILGVVAASAARVISETSLRLSDQTASGSALQLAAELQAEIGRTSPATPGTIKGSAGGLDWIVAISPDLTSPPPAQQLSARAVEITVRWRTTRGLHQLRLQTIVLGPASPAP